jgi:hypothetical protein
MVVEASAAREVVADDARVRARRLRPKVEDTIAGWIEGIERGWRVGY